MVDEEANAVTDGHARPNRQIVCRLFEKGKGQKMRHTHHGLVLTCPGTLALGEELSLHK